MEIRTQDDKKNKDFYAGILKKILMNNFNYNLERCKGIKSPDGIQ